MLVLQIATKHESEQRQRWYLFYYDADEINFYRLDFDLHLVSKE